MGLAPRERETLTAIEDGFRATDPRFAAMFLMLGNLGRRGKGRLRTSASVWAARRGAVNVIMLLLTVLTLLTTCAVAAALLA